MSRINLVICLIFHAYLFISPVVAAENNHFVVDEVIIGYKQDATEDQIRSVEYKYGIVAIERFPSLAAILYRLPSTSNPENISKQIGQEPAVRYSEPNYLHKLHSLTPDPDFSNQWYLGHL